MVNKVKHWKVYRGIVSETDIIPNHLHELPAAPPWRSYSQQSPRERTEAELRAVDNSIVPRDRQKGVTFRVRDELIDAVNVALCLRRPLLLTGKPGTGKSSLIYSVARELRLGQVLRWPIISKTTLKDGLYQYDALGRLHEQQICNSKTNIGDFIELGPLGTALLPTDIPRPLLLDEIDKSDFDFPNDLLNIFEEGEFVIPELARAKEPTVSVRKWRTSETVEVTNGYVGCDQFPFVVMTSNGEREFSAPFLRRCIRVEIKQPSREELELIVMAHLKELDNESKQVIDDFAETLSTTERATDQLLNAIFLMRQAQGLGNGDAANIRDRLLLRQLTSG